MNREVRMEGNEREAGEGVRDIAGIDEERREKKRK